MKMKKLTLNLLAITMIFSLTACKSTRADDSEYVEDNNTTIQDTNNNQSNGDITFLTRDFQLDSKYQELARIYEQETGIKINFTTTESMSDDEYFNSFSEDNAPTIFELRGYSDYDKLKDYTKDLSGFNLYSQLNENVSYIQDDTSMGVFGIPHSIEGHGILYNKAILDKYFILEGAKFNSIEQITNYDNFKILVEDMSARKDELQINGVFSATSLKEGEDDLYYKNLGNIPLYHEIKQNQVDINNYYEDDINLNYHENFNNMYDLYLNNSTTDRDMLYTVSQEDALREFALGQSAMIQGSNTSYRFIDSVEGRIVDDLDIKMLPIYTGIEGEENYSISLGSNSYLAINKNSTQEQQMLAEDFLNWLHSSSVGKDFVTNQLGYETPFMTYTEQERVNNPIANEVRNYSNDTTKATIPFYYNHVKDTSYIDRLRGDVDNMGDNMRSMGDDMYDMGEDMTKDFREMGDDLEGDFEQLDNSIRENLVD